jgi:hypothetical protein
MYEHTCAQAAQQSVALLPPPQPPCCRHRAAAVALCPAAVLRAAATAADAAMLPPTSRCRAAATAAASALLPPRCCRRAVRPHRASRCRHRRRVVAKLPPMLRWTASSCRPSAKRLPCLRANPDGRISCRTRRMTRRRRSTTPRRRRCWSKAITLGRRSKVTKERCEPNMRLSIITLWICHPWPSRQSKW